MAILRRENIMANAKLSEQEVDGLRLIQRSTGVGEWKGPVTMDGLWKSFADYPTELVEKLVTGEGRFLRLTSIGRGIIEWT